MHVHCGNPAVFVRRIVIDSLVCVTAGSVNRYFVFILPHMAAAPLLFHTAQDVEKLAHALCFRSPGHGVQLRKRSPDKTGLGRKVSRKPQGAHSLAIDAKRQLP